MRLKFSRALVRWCAVLLDKLVAGALVASAGAVLIALGRAVLLFCLHGYSTYIHAVRSISGGF